MGLSESKETAGGTLVGAYGPPLDGISTPEPPKGARKFYVRVPEDAKPGESFIIEIEGENFRVHPPSGVTGGMKFPYKHPAEIHKVFASTLNNVPGMLIVQSKPIIWSSVSHNVSGSGAKRMTHLTQTCLQDAQAELLRQAIATGCNACLGINFNITASRVGRDNNTYNDTAIVVTAYGTPCSVVLAENMPAVRAEAVVQPLFNADVIDTE